MIWIGISDTKSLGSWYIKGTDEFTLVMDSSVPLMYHGPSDLGSLILIQITPKKGTQRLFEKQELCAFSTKTDSQKRQNAINATIKPCV